MVLKIIEVPLDLTARCKGPLPTNDLLRAVGAHPAFVKVFEGAKITFDTGKLLELIREMRPAHISDGQLKELLDNQKEMLEAALFTFGTMMLVTTSMFYTYGDAEGLKIFLKRTNQLASSTDSDQLD